MRLEPRQRSAPRTLATPEEGGRRQPILPHLSGQEPFFNNPSGLQSPRLHFASIFVEKRNTKAP